MDGVALGRRRVLVTGATGTVGRYVVKELAASGYAVVATGLNFQSRTVRDRGRFVAPGEPAHRVEFQRADLTDTHSVSTLLRQTQPDVIVHLAAVIPPYTYQNAAVSRRVNVDGTSNLVRAAERLPEPPHFLQASSMAVYGARNPHRRAQLIDLDTPTVPTELYGAQKLAAEHVVQSSSLKWTILRLGGVLSPDISLSGDASLVAMEAALPIDGRIHTVAVEDVAIAFERSVAAMPVGEIFLIGGDQTHRLIQQQVGHGIASAMGLRDVLPAGRIGAPEDDRKWFITDWLDTERSQEVLNYQNRTFEDVLIEIRRNVGWRRWLLRIGSPIARRQLARSGPYVTSSGRFADPWAVIADRWGWPLLEPDSSSTVDQT